MHFAPGSQAPSSIGSAAGGMEGLAIVLGGAVAAGGGGANVGPAWSVGWAGNMCGGCSCAATSGVRAPSFDGCLPRLNSLLPGPLSLLAALLLPLLLPSA